MAIGSLPATSTTPPRPRALSALATYAVPNEIKTDGVADGIGYSVAKFANHVYESYRTVEPAHAAFSEVPGALFGHGPGIGAAMGDVGRVVGHAGILSGAVSGVMSLVLHGFRFFNHQETGSYAARQIALDTTAGAAGGIGAAVLSGLTTTLVGALGLAGGPLMFVGLIAGFIGYSWLDNLVRSKVLGYLDWKQNGQPPASSPTPPATKQAAVGTV